MTDTDYARLRELAEKATPGPWVAETRRYGSDAGDYHASHIPGVADEPASGYDIEPTGAMEAEDAEFIAATDPQTVIALLDEIERLRGEVEWEYGENVGYKRKYIVPRDVACITWGTAYRRRKAGVGPWVPIPEGENDEC